MPNPRSGPNASPVNITHASGETAEWRDFIASITPGDPDVRINGYFIPIGDINAINALAVNGIRAYFALRPTPQGNKQVHLYIVPVDEFGNDIIELNNESMIYDTTMPCPTMCGGGNPLNGGA